ncbi:MAG: excinuclease ABC subunit UvrA [Thermoguttaceae bacterium]|nr:excinuclease ABC subunit UvrA [Thermoguttaceae bacterium]MDW8037218.1 excinuclease ABC subunit UvrA [Thermoguttaceae bacterium]
MNQTPPGTQNRSRPGKKSLEPRGSPLAIASLVSSPPSEVDQVIRIRGARVHNLQNIDLDLPRDRLIVITGPSGSGKSSLAFDTLYAEGQRQYLESLSVYARQFLPQLERPDVDLIDGLPPTISIDQRLGIQNPRSTVATVTEIYDYLRLLYARLGEASCYRCGATIRQQTPEEILDALMSLAEGTRVILLAPIVRGRKGHHKEVFEQIRKAGYVRARVDGQIVEVDPPPELARQKLHTIEAVVDRLVVRRGLEQRLAESIRQAVDLGDGLVVAAYEDRRPTAQETSTAGGKSGTADGGADGGPPAAKPAGSAAGGLGKEGGGWHDLLFSTRYACPNCKIGFQELEPRTFSFNSPYGACPDCEGLGVKIAFDPELIAPDRSLSIAEGGIVVWKELPPVSRRRHQQAVEEFLQSVRVRPSTPLRRLSAQVWEQLLWGNEKGFLGILRMLEKDYVTTLSDAVRQRLEAYRSRIACQACGGARLREEARAVRVAGRAIHQMTAMTVRQARQFFAQLQFPAHQRPIAEPILAELRSRLAFLDDVGLDYLTLDRATDTLSGGELQRVRLAMGLGSGLVGVCYVLDEPSIGLHPRDNHRLIEALRAIQQRGNTVIVVEHDEAIMRRADWLVDLGPGAGKDGGRIVAQGTLQDLAQQPQSRTGLYLAGREQIPTPTQRRKPNHKQMLIIEGAQTNNLKNITVRFPLGLFICVTGVSGSGKSSLLAETLAPALLRHLGQAAPKPGPFSRLRGAPHIEKVIPIDQSPIGRTPRSNPATYTGVFDEIRKVFAQTRLARQRGYTPSRFSFNLPGGRCEQCEGQGQQRIEMNFLPDLYVTCPACEGRRFNPATLEVLYKDKSIADVLNMRVEEAKVFFENFPAIVRILSCLEDVGLGYLSLGQSSLTLSGGEAQRVKLATELSRVETGKTLYILDEPTTGLHFDDVRRLLDVLNRLVDRGNTVIVIEHHLDVIKSADWIIDLGPEGGEGGGYLLAEGPPEQIASLPDNATGRFLRTVLNRQEPHPDR